MTVTNLLNISHSYIFISIKIIDTEGVVKLDIPGSVLAEAGEQQHELIEGEVPKAVRGENLTNPLSEGILLELRTLG